MKTVVVSLPAVSDVRAGQRAHATTAKIKKNNNKYWVFFVRVANLDVARITRKKVEKHGGSVDER